MSNSNHFNSLCNLILPCLGFIFLKGKSSDSSSRVSELPNSLILEIILRLPIQSIIRCKLVSKSWHNIISDPCFAINYFKTPPFTCLALSQHSTVTDPLDVESFCFLEIGSDDDVIRTPINPRALDFPRTGIVSIMGSCNGLLCVVQSPRPELDNRDIMYNNQNVYVINPLFGQRVELPRVKSSKYFRNVIYGFGSNVSENEYKVVRIAIRYLFIGNSTDYKIKTGGKIFTLGVDTKWRSFDDSSIPCHLFPCGITLNGVIHWIGDDNRSGMIVSFDVGEERGYRIPLPSVLGDAPGIIILSVWGDNLCLTDNSSKFQVVIWTMKQYGVEESWSRDVILKTSIPRELRLDQLIPITTLRNGDLLLSRSTGQSLISYKPGRRKLGKFKISDVEGTFCFLHGYTPNFSSLKSIVTRNRCSIIGAKPIELASSSRI